MLPFHPWLTNAASLYDSTHWGIVQHRAEKQPYGVQVVKLLQQIVVRPSHEIRNNKLICCMY